MGIKVKFPPWVQGEGVLKRDGSIGWHGLYPGDTVTLRPGDYMRVADATINVHRDGTLSVYPGSQAKASAIPKGRAVPDGVEWSPAGGNPPVPPEVAKE